MISEFHKYSGNKCGVRGQCKECRNNKTKEEREAEVKRVRRWYKNLTPAKKAKRAKYIKEYHKKMTPEKKEKLAECRKIWAKKHPEKIKEYQKKTYQKRKAKIAIYIKNKRKTDCNFMIACRLYARIRKVLKGHQKGGSTISLLGCSVEQFRNHIENQFQNGMDWENYGLWQLDHIRPCSSFDLSNPIEQKRCFHYKNIQPLWETENKTKGTKWVGDAKFI